MPESPASSVDTGTPIAGTPNNVTGLTTAFAFATVGGTANTPVINFSWTLPSGPPSPTSYNIWRGTAAGGETPYASGVTALNYQDVTVSPITTYFYYVVAVNSSGSSSALSAASSEVSQKTACLAPTNLVITIGDGHINGTFTGSAGATGYNVYSKLHSGSTYTLSLPNIQTTSFNLTGLTDGLSYDIYVTAID